jgi:hypothetical protein
VDLNKLKEVFERQEFNGAYVHDDAQVREIIPALFLLSGTDISDIKSDEMKLLMGQFCRKLGLPEDVSTNDFAKKAAAYYRENPPDAKLLNEIRQACET